MMGHLNSFSASEVGNLNKMFPKFKCPGDCPGGGGCLSFDLTDTLLNLRKTTMGLVSRGMLWCTVPQIL